MEEKDICAGKRVILVVASQGYDHDEYEVAKDMLERVGVVVVTASDKPGGAVAQDDRSTAVDMTIEEIDLTEFDGLFFIGGAGAIGLPSGRKPGAGLNPLNCLDIPASYELVSRSRKINIPYGAIGTAVQILVKCYGLEGKRATGHPFDYPLTALWGSFGVDFQKEHAIVTDDLVVTAQDASAAPLFADGILRVLRKKALSGESV